MGNNAQRRRMNKHRQTGLRANTPNPLGPRAWRRKEGRRVRLDAKASARRLLLRTEKKKRQAARRPTPGPGIVLLDVEATR